MSSTAKKERIEEALGSYEPYWFPELASMTKKLYLLWGPRMGYKTSCTSKVLMLFLNRPHDENSLEGRDAFVGREYETDIDESVWKNFRKWRQFMGIDHLFRDVESENYSEYLPTGRQVHFGGLYAKSKRGGLRGLDNYGFLWLDEMQESALRSFLHLLNTIKRNKNTIVIATGNRDEHSAFWKIIQKNAEDPDNPVKSKNPNVMIQFCHWRDADLLPPSVLAYIAEYKRDWPELYPHDFEGEKLVQSDFIVFKEGIHYEFRDLDEHVADMQPLYAFDFGKTTSANAAARVYYLGDSIYVHTVMHDYEIKPHHLAGFLCGPDVDVNGNPRTPQRWECIHPEKWTGVMPAPEASVSTVYCDWDNPNINELNQAGIPGAIQVPFKNRKGSEWQSVEWAKGKKIYIHPTRCDLLRRELPLYSYAASKYDPDEPDRKAFMPGNDHAVDAALRYPFFAMIFNPDGIEEEETEVGGIDEINELLREAGIG